MPALRVLIVYALRTIWVLLCNAICIPCYLGWLLLVSPTYLVSPSLFNQLEQVIMFHYLTIITMAVV